MLNIYCEAPTYLSTKKLTQSSTEVIYEDQSFVKIATQYKNPKLV